MEDIVRPFLPTNYKFRYALNASREIVNGFKYEIIFAVEDENNLEIICLVDVLEKPWLLKDSNKYRKMTYNNCSLINLPDDDDKIKNTFQINPVFQNQRNDVAHADLADMEEQIIPVGSNRRVIATSRGTRPTTTTTSTTEMPESSTEPLNTNSKNLLDDFFNMNNYFPPPQNPTTTTTTTTSTTTTTTTTSLPPISNFNMDALDDIFGIKKIGQVNQMPSKEEGSGEEVIEEKKVDLQEAGVTSVTDNEEALKELEMEIKKTFSELFQSDPDFQNNIIALINRKNDETALKNYNFVINILASKLKDKIEDYNGRNLARDQVNPTIITSSDVTENHNQGETRKKRSTEANKKIWDLAEQAIDKLDYYDEDDHKRVLLNIIDVKESLEQDELYTITATIANSRCLESSNEHVHCSKKIDEMTKKLCLFEVNHKCLTILMPMFNDL